MRILSYFLAVVLISGAGCASTKKPKDDSAQFKPGEDVEAAFEYENNGENENGPPPPWAPKKFQYNPTNPKLHDLLHTKLEVRFDWQKTWLLGKATLKLKPYFYPTDSLILDAKGFAINKVALNNNGNLTDLKYEYNNSKLKIRLNKTYKNTEEYEIYIDYVAKPNELIEGGSAAISSNKGLYFINPDGKNKNKPRQLWTQGETEASSCWFPTIDSPNERTSQEIYMTVENGFITLSNGVMLSSTDNGDGTRTDYWKMEKPHAPYLFMMASGNFAVVKDKWRDIDVNYYVEPEYEKYAKLIFGNTPEMIELFSKKLGVDFPWPKYSQIVVRDFVSGAMENTSATVHMEQLQHDAREHIDEPLEDYISHELFHQWFGDLVTCESWSNLPLNESFATYGEYIWREHKYGRDEADIHLMEDYVTYMTESFQKREPLIRYNFRHREDMFDAHSYQKGSCVLHMLRKTIGDDAFFASLKVYLTRNAYSEVEIDELRMAFEDVTGTDMHWFFDQWFLNAGHPELKIGYNYDADGKHIEVTVKQNQDTRYSPIYKIPTFIEVSSNGIKKLFPVSLETADTLFKIPFDRAPENIDFDPEKFIVALTDEQKEINQWLYQFRNAGNYLQKKTALDNIQVNLDIAAVQQAIIAALDDPFWGIRQQVVEVLNESQTPKTPELLAKIRSMAERDPKSAVRKACFDFIADYADQQEPSALDATLEKGLNDSSYHVQAQALTAIYKRQPEKGLKIAQSLRNEEADPIVYTVSEILMKEKVADATAYVQNALKNMKGVYSKIYLIQSFGEYIKDLDATNQQSGIDYLKNIAMNEENWYARFFAARVLMAYSDREDVATFFQELKEKEKKEELREMYRKLF